MYNPINLALRHTPCADHKRHKRTPKTQKNPENRDSTRKLAVFGITKKKHCLAPGLHREAASF